MNLREVCHLIHTIFTRSEADWNRRGVHRFRVWVQHILLANEQFHDISSIRTYGVGTNIQAAAMGFKADSVCHFRKAKERFIFFHIGEAVITFIDNLNANHVRGSRSVSVVASSCCSQIPVICRRLAAGI